MQSDPDLPTFKDPKFIADWLYTNGEKSRALYKKFRENRIQLAKRDPNTFCELVGVDEETGLGIEQAQLHELFQAIVSRHKFAVIWSHIESGKTSQVSILRVLFELGVNPNKRIAVVSRTRDLAVKIVRAVKDYIETSEILHEIFPNLKKGDKWSDAAITIAGRKGSPKDFSLIALGVNSKVIGARLDLVIMDDVLDYDNTRTEHRRNEVYQWFIKTIAGRLTRNAQCICLGNAWHPKDFMHQLAANPGWKAFTFGVLDKHNNPRWAARWPLERIRAFEQRYGPIEKMRQLDCSAIDDSIKRFNDAWILKAIARGEGRAMPFKLVLPPGYRAYTGVDLGTRTNKKSNLSVLFTIVVHPNGDREVIHVESGQWDGPTIIEKIKIVHKRFGSIVVVENVAAQDFILQFARRDTDVPVVPFTTGRNKVDPEFGIESIGVELFNGKWIIPSVDGAVHPEVNKWLVDMDQYTPEAHTGDHLMACWFAREGARSSLIAPKVKRVKHRFGAR